MKMPEGARDPHHRPQVGQDQRLGRLTIGAAAQPPDQAPLLEPGETGMAPDARDVGRQGRAGHERP